MVSGDPVTAYEVENPTNLTSRHILRSVAYWRLGESSGNVAVDETGNYNGTYVGTPTLGVDGLLVGDADTAVTFDGVNDYVEMDVPRHTFGSSIILSIY